jgi:DNA-binding transcriptional LysR family regulator
MDLKQMRYVVAVAETGNFTRAAERCYVVQSALSHQIKALERELGLELFARTSRKVELTAAGAAFLPAARRALDAADRAVADAAAAVGEVRGHLVVGIIPTVSGIDIPTALRRFRLAHPAVRVRLHVGGSDEFIAGIRAGEIDVAVLGLPAGIVPAGVQSKVIKRDRHVAVVARDHPLAGRTTVDLARLADETFVDFPIDSPGRAQSDLAFAAVGLQRDVAFEVMAADVLVALVRSGLGIALLPSAVAPAGDPGLGLVSVGGVPPRAEHLAWSDFNPSPAAIAFLDVIDDTGIDGDVPAAKPGTGD